MTREFIAECPDCQREKREGKAPPFVAVKGSNVVMRASEFVASACSKTMALRIAAALNVYMPGRRGK
jgi:hypothetical protein